MLKAGLLGIGGGSVISPLLVELNVNPRVGAATSSLMVVISGSISLASYAATGVLNAPYSIVLSCVTLVTSIIGVTLIGWAVRKSGKVCLRVYTGSQHV